MNAVDKKEAILSRLRLKGVFSEQIDNTCMASFHELFDGEINTKINSESRDAHDEKLIEAAPELLQIAEMFHDHMLGNEMERTMIFDIVSNVLRNVK